jgi:hypothetical protein
VMILARRFTPAGFTSRRRARSQGSCGNPIFLFRSAHPDVALLVRGQDHRHRLGWIGSTTAFGAVVKNPYPSGP